MLGGKKSSWMLSSWSSGGWPEKLSRQNSTLRPCWQSRPFQLCNTSSKSFAVIHAFLFALYLTEISLFLKPRGLLDLPIARRGNFLVPLIFAPARRIILCLLFFSSVHRSPLKLMVLFGSNRQKSPVSSRLKTLSVENCLSKGWRTCCCHSKRDCKSTAPGSPCTVLNVMQLRFLKLSGQPSLAMKSGMCIDSASVNAFSLIKSPPTGSFCSLACFSHLSTPSSSFECLAGFSFLRFDGISALMAASFASFLLRIPFTVVLLTSMPHFLFISLASLD